jgi:hypothetical protein
MNFSELHFWSSLLALLWPILLIRPFFIRLTVKNPNAVSLYDRSSLLLSHYLSKRHNILWSCFHPAAKKTKQKSVFIIFSSIKIAPINY